MMRHALIVAGALFLGALAPGCGEGPDAVISPVVRLDGILQDEVDTLVFYAFSSRRTDGVVVPCTSIGEDIMPGDPRLEEYARLEIGFSASDPRSAELSGVPKGRAIVLYAEALLGASLVARACEQDVAAGGTPVDLTFFRI